MIIVFNLIPLFYFLHTSYTRVKKVLILIVIDNTNTWKIFLWKCIKLKVSIECKSVCNILQGPWNRKKSHVCVKQLWKRKEKAVLQWISYIGKTNFSFRAIFPNASVENLHVFISRFQGYTTNILVQNTKP